MNNLKLKRSRKLAKLLHIIRYKQKKKEKEWSIPSMTICQIQAGTKILKKVLLISAHRILVKESKLESLYWEVNHTMHNYDGHKFYLRIPIYWFFKL
jgi:hypothetical protein